MRVAFKQHKGAVFIEFQVASFGEETFIKHLWFFFLFYIEYIYFRIFYAYLQILFRVKPKFYFKIMHPNKESIGFPKLRVGAKQDERFMFFTV